MKKQTKGIQKTDIYDKHHKPRWYAINGRLKVSEAAKDIYDEDITQKSVTVMLTMKERIKDTGGVEIKYNAVQMAISRHKKNLIEPRIKAAMGEVVLTDEDIAPSNMEISGIFRDVIKYKKFAEAQDVKMSIGEITTLLDKSNQLKKNEHEYIKKDVLVDATCSLILQFRLSVDADPEINDPLHMFMEDEQL